MIPCACPLAQYRSQQHAINRAIRSVLSVGRYVLGPQVEAFEREFAAYIGVPFGVGVASGTDAIAIGLRSLGIGPGDEVITVAHTAVASVAAIVQAGATPVFVDVRPDDLTIDPARIEPAITRKTRAVIAVHLYGQPADIASIRRLCRRRRLALIEDAAQAHGAREGKRRVGSFGDLAAFSFYPTKNLGAIGDGGMIVTRHRALAERVRQLREYGWDRRRVCLRSNGWNSRLDEIQAAVLRVKLRTLDSNNAKRRRIAGAYGRLLRGVDVTLPASRQGCEPVHHLYVIRTAHRDQMRLFLAGQGIQSLIHYDPPAHLHPAFRAYSKNIIGVGLSVTESAAREVLSLPMYPELTAPQVREVAAAVREFFS